MCGAVNYNSAMIDFHPKAEPPQPLYSDVLERAARLAARGHYHQFRKRDAGAVDPPPLGVPLAEDRVPYVTHLVGVMCILARIGASERILAAALLHDYIEDVSDPQARTTVAAAVVPWLQ